MMHPKSIGRSTRGAQRTCAMDVRSTASAAAGVRHAGSQPRIRVRIEPKFNYWGQPLPRRIPDRVIQKALLRRATAADGFLMQALAGMPNRDDSPVQIRTADFQHFQEGDYQMVFRVSVRLQREPRPRRLCVLVTKGDAASVRVATAEYSMLRRWSSRAPGLVVAPYASESIVLPVNSAGGKGGRLFAYATPWIDGYHELGVTADMRFFVNEQPLQRFPVEWTDRIKARILALCWSLYDPAKGIMPAPPLIGAGDIMITRPQRQQIPRVILIAARGERRVATIKDCLLNLLTYQGDWGGRQFTLRPRDPACLWDAVHDGLVVPHGISEKEARQALEAVV